MFQIDSKAARRWAKVSAGSSSRWRRYEDVIELGTYQAGPWKHAQRLILVIIDRPDPKTGQLPLIPEHFFLVTNWEKGGQA